MARSFLICSFIVATSDNKDVSLLGSPSSSDDEELDDDGHDNHTIKGELDMAG
jgi:hypothetical protein